MRKLCLIYYLYPHRIWQTKSEKSILKNETTDLLRGWGGVHSTKPADIQTLRCILWPLSLEAQSKVTDQSLEFYVLLFLCTSFFCFLASLALCCCTWDFTSWSDGRCSVAVLGLLTEVASLVADHRLQSAAFSNCGMSAQ